ncbi:carboxypeptidase regulatory-like domain-containing protein [Novosphingobium flavum]|uniref:Carboxypeptidase regulatory-like domain-containing protein n=1 Tax=Novosphingobium flavum TaxID=1778672 RepID=A0A7X1FUL2_9SPHN|nr:carboxypeptidase-like regulatory domain-containing protein [Novosphingobium flavum]MBC2667265.1 carboxypeptidase regulatory-like domain-containing protein [Novosphingobium flavum]
MHFRYFLAASAASLSLACGLAAPAMAQETTSAIAGEVTGENGAPFAGAKITVVHTPSGTTSVASSDSSGHFSLRGLRVGGPYAVTVDGAGFAPETIDGIQLYVGDTLSLPVQLSTREILVSGAAQRLGRELNTGSQTSFNAEDIANTVSSRRDIRDVMSKDLLASYNPNAGGVSIAGGNIRTQRFSVDGMQMQDSFGLNYGGLPSSRGIVSLEAIDQLTVKAAPFDISEGNFQGGAVNVVLKSGSNDIHGTGFVTWGGPKWTGKYGADVPVLGGASRASSPATFLNFRNFGGSLSGPLIKDKLFFAVTYEKLSEGTPFFYGAQGTAANNRVPNLYEGNQTVTSALSTSSPAYPFGSTTPNASYLPMPTGGYGSTLLGLNSLYSLYTNTYGSGFDIGTVPTAIAETDRKLSGKLDWNIAPGHRFSLTYIGHENVLPNWGSTGGSTSATSPYIQLLSDLYKVTEHTDAFTGQYNGQFGDRLTVEARAAYKWYKRGQDAFNGPDFAQFNVCLDPSSTTVDATYNSSGYVARCSSGTPIVRMGPDTPRQANAFNSRTYTFAGNIGYQAGAHTFKLEYDHMYSSLYNLFVYGTSGTAGTGGPQGLYYFDSVADFSAKQANELVLYLPSTGNKADGYVRWAYSIDTVALQDTWKPSSKLAVNGGLRFDMYGADKTIAANQNFINRYATLYPGLNNTATLAGRVKLQPRFGFNWAPTPSFKLAGGFGLFAGGVSDVYISNNYSNSGAALNSTGATLLGVDIVRTSTGCYDNANKVTPSAAVCNAALSGVTGSSVPQAVVDYLKTNTGVLANALTNFMDPNYKIPAQWKYNLSATWRPDFGDSDLARNWTFRADVLFSDTQQAVRWTDIRASRLLVGGVAQVAPDGRLRYDSSVGGNYDMMLTNTSRGISRVFAVGVAKTLPAVDFSFGYTHTVVHDVVGPLVSSTVSSNYGVPTSDPNSGGDYGRSAFETRHILRASFELHHAFFGDNQTRFGVNWQYRSGQPWSVTMTDGTGRGAVFGTVLNNSSHLLYVPDFSLAPTNGGLTYGIVTFNSTATRDALQNLVNSTALKGYQGQIAPKNLLTGPWYNKVDLNFSQELPVAGRAKVTAILTIENFLNMLNRNWGSYIDYGVSNSVVQVTCTGATTNGQACPSYLYSTYAAPTGTAYAKPSLYTIRAGIRASF